MPPEPSGGPKAFGPNKALRGLPASRLAAMQSVDGNVTPFVCQHNIQHVPFWTSILIELAGKDPEVPLGFSLI